MKIKLAKRPQGVTLFLEGRLDGVTAPEVQDILLDAAGRYGDLTLDFTDLDYITSAGLRVLLVLQRRMNQSGGGLRIAGANQGVREVFELTGFSDFLSLE